MRVLSITSALLFAAASMVPQTAEAARTHHRSRTMAVKLANGRTVHFQIVRMHGQMMVMAPYNAFRDVFHGAEKSG